VPRNSAAAVIIPDATFRTGASIYGPLVSRGSPSAGSGERTRQWLWTHRRRLRQYGLKPATKS
jgi:hypothetical protein